MSTANGTPAERSIPAVSDWLVGDLLIVVGLLVAAGGYVVGDVVDES